jgi:hypothetical protein
MLHKITDGDKFVCYVSDEMNDQINEEALKMLKEWLNEPVKINKPIYKNTNERTLSKSRRHTKSNKRK